MLNIYNCSQLFIRINWHIKKIILLLIVLNLFLVPARALDLNSLIKDQTSKIEIAEKR